ncbi:glycoside hydrolase family 5 protein [Kineothrix sp. MSJ-39]|uniref:glycoside hydrolase family 5 protein n=1 Tax=Kineothrix sp. MSJ-39 TaxID=2841533 RepID=UPI001C114044|nr:cellulase family glycosylhydrolase [Kineothrix sp. MSJ-39]MBU5429579.1 glycoside hydrolase family 5 protein [Kineothrix sp. MSJ-39]
MKQLKGFMHGINLGGWLSQCSEYTEDHYKSFIKENDIKIIADWGLDHVRIPIDYNVIEDENGNVLETGYLYIDNCVTWCRKYGLNLILDLHRTKGFSFDNQPDDNIMFEDENLRNRFLSLWKTIALRYGKVDIIAFELLNEITNIDAGIWNSLAAEGIKELRKIVPDKKIIIGGVFWNSVHSLSQLDIPLDENIVYNFHFYEPFLFTHQGAYWQPVISNISMKYPGDINDYRAHAKELGCFGSGLNNTDEMGEKFMDALITEAVDAAAKADVPVYCGEYGVIDKANIDGTLSWYQDISKVFDKYGIGRAVWTYKAMDFGLTDEHYNSRRDEIIKCL